MKKNTENDLSLKDSLKKLNTIVSWFESQDDLDIEKGLEYVKEGASLIKNSREKLSKIENEFKEIKREIQS